MLKRTVATVVGILLIGLTGCCGQLKKQNQSLQTQVIDLEEAREMLLADNETLKTHAASLEVGLVEAKKEADQMARLLGELKGEEGKLQRERLELEKLARRIEGFTIEQRPEGNFIVMDSEILFASGKADLKEDAKASLDRIADYLLQKSALEIRVDGHTDAVPIKHSGWQDNYQLAAMRAHAVMAYLGEKGVASERMYVVGFGPNRPLVQPEDPLEPMAENRRVEILLVPEGIRSITEILEGFKD